MEYKIGSRGSKLAIAQANIVAETLSAAYPNDRFIVVPYKTTGDKDSQTPIDSLGQKGVFVDTIEEALLSGEIQIAVHSMKDMPELPRDGLVFSKTWKREDARDVLVVRQALWEEVLASERGAGEAIDEKFEAGKILKLLPPHARIATGSKRRSFSLLRMRPDIEIVPIRGNIDTRIRKLNEGIPEDVPIDAIVVAAAGLKRLGMEDAVSAYFDPGDMVPAPAQGALAIEIREDDEKLRQMLDQFSDPETDFAVGVERDFLKTVGGGCTLPIGAYCEKTTEGYILYTCCGDANGDNFKIDKFPQKSYN